MLLLLLLRVRTGKMADSLLWSDEGKQETLARIIPTFREVTYYISSSTLLECNYEVYIYN